MITEDEFKEFVKEFAYQLYDRNPRLDPNTFSVAAEQAQAIISNRFTSPLYKAAMVRLIEEMKKK
jgi:hypothetical protein